jgi:tRNA A-37 threonylcarbamoyl transferase component Bud32/HAMP domain-containing protein
LTQTAPETPQQLGRYKITEKVGEGAMSVVYKAFDAEINRYIAIKQLRPEIVRDPESRTRFLSEARAAGNLIHPNIVTIFDVGEGEQGPYIAMDFLDGPTLEARMRQESKPSLREILDIGIQLAEGLDHAHQNGVVHRDVKPSNIILMPGRNMVRITDFGIAHIDSADKLSHTVSGTLLGTPQYMSPEQAEGQPVDGRSDLFSVGIILYQLAAGQLPFSAKTLASLYMSIVKEDPVPLKKRVPDLPAGLSHAIEKLLNKDPAKRFSSAGELAAVLRNLAAELDAREKHEAEAKVVPLRVRYTVTLAVLLAVIMVIAAVVGQHYRVGAMTMLVVDFGSSLARFVASQSAEPVLLEDWVAVELFVQEAQERQQIRHLRIVDRNDVIRGSTVQAERGQPFSGIPGDKRIVEKSEQLMVREVEFDASLFLDFEVPILYKQKEIGRVYLGLSKQPLEQAANLTLYIMIGLILAVFATVVVAFYLMVSRITAPMEILHNALRQTAQGNLAQRISEKRNDELGRMFEEFNAMAENLERMKDEWSAAGGQSRPAGTANPAADAWRASGAGVQDTLAMPAAVDTTLDTAPGMAETVVAPPPAEGGEK